MSIVGYEGREGERAQVERRKERDGEEKGEGRSRRRALFPVYCLSCQGARTRLVCVPEFPSSLFPFATLKLSFVRSILIITQASVQMRSWRAKHAQLECTP